MGSEQANQVLKDEDAECTFYHNKGMNEYICKLNVNLRNLASPEFIFIVDKSGSMGSYFNYIISKSIPNVLNSLGYKNKKIHLITFDDKAYYFNIYQSDLKKLNLNSGGRTYMSKSYEILEEKFNSLKKECNNLRILAISDGILHDQKETQQKGQLLYEKYKNIFNINSQSIRLYTNSKEKPDTSGIISFLKFNNVKGCELISHEADKIRDLEKVIISLFKDDGLNGNYFKINGDNVNLKNFPWEKSSNSLPLKNGDYTFFSDKIKPLYISNEKKIISIKCKEGNNINNSNYESIVGKEKISNIFQLFKFNKSLNTNESKNENKLILDYFDNLFKKTNDKNIKYLKKKLDFYNDFNDKKNINNLDEDTKALYSTNIEKYDEKEEIKKYEKNYNESSFWSKIKKYGAKIGVKPIYAALILFYALPKVSLADKAIIIGSLGYLISPLDIIPDCIPVVGYMDDIAFLFWATHRIYSNVKNIDPSVIEKAKEKVRDFFGNDVNEEDLTI